jgi:heme/copper-type cytochrome/quinol oxidase subunit 1
MRSGLDERLDPASASLLHGWLLFALGAAGVAGVLASLVAVARTPALRALMAAESFYVFLAGHVTFSLVIWLLGFVVVAAVYAGAAAQGVCSPRLGRWGLWLSAAGGAVLLAAILMRRGEVFLNDYVPVLDTPLFFAGYALFAAGVAISVVNFLLLVARLRERPLPLPAYGMAAATACVVIAILALAVGMATVGSRSYPVLVWGTGQALQYAYMGTTAVAWYVLAGSILGAALPERGPARLAFALYPLLALPIPFLYLLLDPYMLPKVTGVNVLLGAGLSLPTIVHMVVVAGLFVQAKRATARPLLRQTLSMPEAAALVLSLLLFLVGGLLEPSGARGTLRVAAHYHAMLVGGVTLALMGLTYHLLKTTGRGIASLRLARVQPYLFGLGVLLTVFALAWAGILGAPRKTYEVGAAAWSGPMNMMGLGAALAALGGGAFVVNVLLSLLQRRTRPTPSLSYRARTETIAP